jgi:hypothetical protein
LNFLSVSYKIQQFGYTGAVHGPAQAFSEGDLQVTQAQVLQSGIVHRLVWLVDGKFNIFQMGWAVIHDAVEQFHKFRTVEQTVLALERG